MQGYANLPARKQPARPNRRCPLLAPPPGLPLAVPGHVEAAARPQGASACSGWLSCRRCRRPRFLPPPLPAPCADACMPPCSCPQGLEPARHDSGGSCCGGHCHGAKAAAGLRLRCGFPAILGRCWSTLRWLLDATTAHGLQPSNLYRALLSSPAGARPVHSWSSSLRAAMAMSSSAAMATRSSSSAATAMSSSAATATSSTATRSSSSNTTATSTSRSSSSAALPAATASTTTRARRLRPFCAPRASSVPASAAPWRRLWCTRCWGACPACTA